ncbi:MAG: hypothetical protein ACLPLR_14190 [Terriglobales bacterium]
MIPGANVPLLVFVCVVLFVVGGLIVFWTLRKRARKLQRARMPAPAKPPWPTAPVGFLAHSSVDLQIQPIELYFGKSESESKVTISAIKAADLPQTKHAIDVASAKLSELNPLLQLVPSVLTAAEFEKGDYMRVLVNGPLAISRDAHSFLPFVRGADGKVSELAQLDTGRLCQIVNTAMVWQFASVIVAQKHLADINKKLDGIKKGIDDILAFLETERVSKITGALRYLDQVIQSIMHGEFDEAIRLHLESVERDLISVQDHLTSELRDGTEKIAEIEHSELFGTGDLTQKIKEHQDRIYRVQQQWILCVRARAANWQILSAFPGVERLTIDRKAEILKSIQEVTAYHRPLKEKMRSKISEVDSFFNRPETIRERKTTLETRFGQYQDTFMISASEIEGQVSQVAAEQIAFSQKPMVIALKVVQGRVQEAYELDER